MQPNFLKQLLDEPLSTANLAFTQIVDMALSEGETLIVLVRYAYSAGSKEYTLIRNIEKFYAILQNSRSKTSISVFFEKMLPIRGVANKDTLLQAVEFLKEQPKNEKEVFVVRLNPPDMTSECDVFVFETPEEITSWFRENMGVSIIVGGLRFWESNSDRVVTAYVPDEDGVVRPGAY